MQLNEFGWRVGKDLKDFKRPAFPSNISLEGRHVKLVNMDIERDSRKLWETFGTDDDFAAAFTYMLHPAPKNFEEFVAYLEDIESDRETVLITVLSRESQEPAGYLSYLRIAPQHATLEVGRIHFPQWVRKTLLSTETQYLMMKHAFDLGYRRYEWKCNNLNEPSKRAALRLGFRFEGIFKNHYIVQGYSRDTAWHAITDDEWPAAQKGFELYLNDSNFVNGKQIKSLKELRNGDTRVL